MQASKQAKKCHNFTKEKFTMGRKFITNRRTEETKIYSESLSFFSVLYYYYYYYICLCIVVIMFPGIYCVFMKLAPSHFPRRRMRKLCFLATRTMNIERLLLLLCTLDIYTEWRERRFWMFFFFRLFVGYQKNYLLMATLEMKLFCLFGFVNHAIFALLIYNY